MKKLMAILIVAALLYFGWQVLGSDNEDAAEMKDMIGNAFSELKEKEVTQDILEKVKELPYKANEVFVSKDGFELDKRLIEAMKLVGVSEDDAIARLIDTEKRSEATKELADKYGVSVTEEEIDEYIDNYGVLEKTEQTDVLLAYLGLTTTREMANSDYVRNAAKISILYDKVSVMATEKYMEIDESLSESEALDKFMDEFDGLME